MTGWVKKMSNEIERCARDFSLGRMYELKGEILGLCYGGLISDKEYSELSGRICRDWLNNGKWVQMAYAHPIDYSGRYKAERTAILAEKGVKYYD